MTNTTLFEYTQDPYKVARGEQLWNQVELDDFDPDSLSGFSLADLMFVCTRIDAHKEIDFYSRMQSSTEDSQEANSEDVSC